MRDAVKFSIVIPVYNVAEYVGECLDSVLKQTHAEWEAICVDDGSIDGSADILEAYAAKDRRFRVIHQKNSGVSVARNEGVLASTGDYLIFVDGDDAIVPFALEYLATAVDKAGGADIVTYGYIPVTTIAGAQARYAEVSVGTSDLDDRGACRSAFRSIVGNLLAWNGCYRREFINVHNLRFKPYPNGEDALFGMEAFCSAKRIAQCSQGLYLYRMRENSAVRSYTIRHLKSVCHVAEEMCKSFFNWSFSGFNQDVFQKKLRVFLVGIGYDVGGKLPLDSRSQGDDLLYDTIVDLHRRFPTAFSAMDSLSICSAEILRSKRAMRLLLAIPFAVRAKLARVRNGLKGDR